MKPGEDIVVQGIEDLTKGLETIPSLLVSIGAPRLRRIGLAIPANTFPSPEHRLYYLLSSDDPNGAHSKYNSWIRRLVSYERAAECRELASKEKIVEFMRLFGSKTRTDVRVYFTGGSTAVLHSWRESTLDIDLRFDPEPDDLFRAIPGIKERLNLNVELAAPSDFIPELPGWQDRCEYIGREGTVTFFHYDPYSQALSKIERGHDQDVIDVESMLKTGMLDRQKLLELFQQIQPLLYKYPAIAPLKFAEAVRSVVNKAEV